MDNVRFLYIRPTGYGQGYKSSEQIEVVFEICPKLTERLRKHAQCPPYMLCRILDENGHYYYQFPLKRDGEDRQRLLRFIKKVEQIGNENDDDYLFSHIITDNKKPWTPGDLRDLITTKYDVPDPEDMLKVYMFFINLEGLLLNIWDDD